MMATGSFHTMALCDTHKNRAIISAYERGASTLADSLTKTREHLGHTYIHQMFTYDDAGHKVPKTVIDFGLPVQVSFVFD